MVYLFSWKGPKGIHRLTAVTMSVGYRPSKPLSYHFVTRPQSIPYHTVDTSIIVSGALLEPCPEIPDRQPSLVGFQCLNVCNGRQSGSMCITRVA